MKRLLFLIPLLMITAGDAAEYRTPNFKVTADDAELARKVGETAEFYRAKHARDWLGKEMPKWSAPCPIVVKSGPNMGNGGATTFSLAGGEVFGWSMNVQGTPQGLIDSTVPHEVLHTIFASHFRRPIPRWADEGAATSVESESEKQRQRLLAAQVVGTQKQFPIRQLLKLQEYPAEMDRVAVLYAQGFYLAEFLIEQKGKREFIRFLESYFKTNDWDTAFKSHYGYLDQEAAMVAAYYARQADSQAATPVEYDRYHIDFFSQQGCKACMDWIKNEYPQLKKMPHLLVKYIDLSLDQNKDRGKQDDITKTPAFIVYKNGVKQKVVRDYCTWHDLLDNAGLNGKYAMTPADTGTKRVQAAQGLGIGYFGPVGGNKQNGRTNPHGDFSAAQTQLLNQLIDQRAQLAIDSTISARLADLKALIVAEIKSFVLEAQAKLTDEQKALINATDSQKSIIAGFQSQVEAVEAGKAEFIKATEAAQAENEKKVEALAAEVEAAKNESATVKEKLAALAKEGAATAANGLMSSLGVSTPPALALTLIGSVATFFWNRRKKDELAKQ